MGGMGGTSPCAGGMSSYRDVVLCDAPIGYWRLGDNGNVAVDEIQTHNGQYNGGIVQQVPGGIAGDPDQAAEFPGNNALITFGDVFDLTGEISLEAWIKPDLVDSTYRYVISKVQQNNQEGFGLYIHQTMGITFVVIGANVFVSSSATQYTLGEWHHVVGTWNGSTARLYLDGVAQTPLLVPVTLIDNAEPFRIGAFDSTGGAGFDGVIDEVAIYDHALEEPRIIAHHQAGL
ncbi:MAG TPA: LamG domain-containing protein, partial [Polyangiaceae bacterium]|nr:LamG domain-containing protein [Polyangiaceae bacterium]